ncbi:MAG: hypothetical protein R2941_04525 [Desulfobacterales bacterium]
MKLLYGKEFDRDLDGIRNDAKTKKRAKELISIIRNADSPADLKNMKIAGYSDY